MLGYVTGAYDILRAKDLQQLEETIQKNNENGNDIFAVAVYENELCEMLGLNVPLKSIEDRMKIIEQISGVDFAFSINSLDNKLIKQKAEEALKVFKENNDKKTTKQEEKKYDIVYCPGTYDLFHAGHLENLLEASKNAKRLVVGVKADELVKKQKGELPKINAEERMEILRHFKFVDNVVQFYTRDLHVASDRIEAKYKQKPDAIYCGSDLKKDYKNIRDLNIVYTERDSEKMKERSTSGYKKKLKLRELSVNKNEEKYKAIKDDIIKETKKQNNTNKEKEDFEI